MANWKRRRESFSCTVEVWNDAKAAWTRVRRTYPAWTEFIEAASGEKAERVRSRLGVTELEPAPDRLPTGRRVPAPTVTARDASKSFSCAPAVWADARAAWWAEQDDYPAWSDWCEEALSEKTASTVKRVSNAH